MACPSLSDLHRIRNHPSALAPPLVASFVARFAMQAQNRKKAHVWLRYRGRPELATRQPIFGAAISRTLGRSSRWTCLGLLQAGPQLGGEHLNVGFPKQTMIAWHFVHVYASAHDTVPTQRGIIG